MNKIAKLRIQSALIQQCRCFYCGLAMIEPALPEFTPKELKPKFQKYLRCTAAYHDADSTWNSLPCAIVGSFMVPLGIARI